MAIRRVLIVIFALLAIACGSSEQSGISISYTALERPVAPAMPLTVGIAAPSAVAPAVTSGTPAPGALIATHVINLDSLSPSTVTSEGGCLGPSDGVRRPGAWRCDDIVLAPGDRPVDAVRDPCFGPFETNLMVCIRGIFLGFELTTMRLTRPLPTGIPGWPAPTRSYVIWVEKSDGNMCALKSCGTSLVINGDRLNYFCTDDTGLIGDPQEGRIGTARLVKGVQSLGAYPGSQEETIVELRTVWR